MKNSTLHTEKVAILSRLIKESSLTLEEALLLLKEEEEEEIVQDSVQHPVQQQGWFGHPYTVPLTGSGTVTVPNGFYTLTTGGSNTTTVTTTGALSTTSTADLNN